MVFKQRAKHFFFLSSCLPMILLAADPADIKTQGLAARASIADKQYEQAEKLIASLEKESLPPYQHMAAFLRGELAFSQHRWPEAARYLRSAIPAKSVEQAPWAADALYLLAAASLNLSLDRELSTKNKRSALKECEKALQHAIKIQPSKEAYFLLGRCYLAKWQHFGDKRALEEIKQLGNVFELFYPSDKKLAAYCLKDQVQACLLLATRENYLQGLSLMGKFLNAYQRELLREIEDPSEIFYLQGRLAYEMAELGDRASFYPIAQNALLHNIESYPQGGFVEESQKLLAVLYYKHADFEKAKHLYGELAEKAPCSLFSQEAYFWAANCSEMMGEDATIIRQLRQKVFDPQLPRSLVAEEAYFRFYDLKDYVHGGSQPIQHLAAMEKLYPESPFLIHLHYLTGLRALQEKKISTDEKEEPLLQAARAFSLAAATAENLAGCHKIPENKLPYYWNMRIRALIEKNSALLSLGEYSSHPFKQEHLHEAANSLRQFIEELESGKPPTKHLLSSAALSSFWEEAAFSLAKCYKMLNDHALAIKTLEHMITKYQDQKVFRGCYLSKAWMERGKIYAENQADAQALACFQKAEEAGKGKVLRVDELLDLWIETSCCYQRLKKYEDAMLILSKVINYDAVSPKRVQAMFLRALIYEEQGRFELAKIQLEAIAKKGGVWSQKAREKLNGEIEAVWD